MANKNRKRGKMPWQAARWGENVRNVGIKNIPKPKMRKPMV